MTGSNTKKTTKKSIRDIHRELGFAPAEEAYKSGIDELEIDQALKQELEEKELVHRFINFRDYKKYGFHKQHWVPYKRDSRPGNTVMFNIDPNGFMVRGDLVLAVKPRDWNEARRKELDSINKRKQGVIEQKTKEFREHVASQGIDARVFEE